MKINEGGKTINLEGPIDEIRIGIACHGALELWIVDKEGNESLTYLTLDEAMRLASELKAALYERIKQI
ncbi:MAG: hypothetical protein IJ307_05780 [Bacteroidales bacterium]|nr:hypothetical protein [Bacteroidales bacterium]